MKLRFLALSVVSLLALFSAASHALIYSQIWYQVQADTISYQVVIGRISPAPVNAIEIAFERYHPAYNPNGRFLSAAPHGIPPGWVATVWTGMIKTIIRWETVDRSYQILPGQHLSGFSAVISLAKPIAAEKLTQVYDVYELPDRTGDWNKDITLYGYPVHTSGTTWGRLKLLYRE